MILMSHPLFIPLRTEYFRAFERGEKVIEYRRYGRGWNERTCRIGRPVILSHGYSGARLSAAIQQFEIIRAEAIDSIIYPADCLLAAIALAEIVPVPSSPRTESLASSAHNRPGVAL
jgi:hypothetical protein